MSYWPGRTGLRTLGSNLYSRCSKGNDSSFFTRYRRSYSDWFDFRSFRCYRIAYRRSFLVGSFLLCLWLMQAALGITLKNTLKKEISEAKAEMFTRTVVGDTVGDPFKDTSGPSLNILIKLMSMVAIVMAGLTVSWCLFA